jgi:hypothetical protein
MEWGGGGEEDGEGVAKEREQAREEKERGVKEEGEEKSERRKGEVKSESQGERRRLSS